MSKFLSFKRRLPVRKAMSQSHIIRTGIDSSGHMSIDLSDKDTATTFVNQKNRFSSIKIAK